ncbi:MAG TPA: hypothetical protein IAB26_00115 [Candidatus Limivivens merdigallinarum]|uniref:Uncharacterized protein n=1 Tax=Candidatus Limivivens merdigallinarum TaxID=2840859 RepID=A0A9D0ZUA2_9FIRM|nr:hypothetical protein [Candidatus Limivivens merdigallinarum]
MNLTDEQREKLIWAIQGILGVMILALSVKNSAKVRTKEMERIMKNNAKREERLAKKNYHYKEKLLKKQYQQKLAKK